MPLEAGTGLELVFHMEIDTAIDAAGVATFTIGILSFLAEMV